MRAGRRVFALAASVFVSTNPIPSLLADDERIDLAIDAVEVAMLDDAKVFRRHRAHRRDAKDVVGLVADEGEEISQRLGFSAELRLD